MPTSNDLDRLIEAAKAARANAYAPYSGYAVGAAVRDGQGRVWAGCNVENVSYGLSICAERNAMFQMVAAGGQSLEAAAIFTEDGGMPCGACLQVLSEFAAPGGVMIYCVNPDGQYRRYNLQELLPKPFHLNRDSNGPAR